MTRTHKIAIAALVLVLALPALADDQGKAKKELDKITAMASDATGRRITNVTMAEMLQAKRRDLLMQRRENEINYGDLFLAYQIAAQGAKLEDVFAQVKAGKPIYDVANGFHVDWKKVADQAKSLNGKVDDNLYTHFAHDPEKTRSDEARADEEAGYNLIYDGVKADNNVSQSDISKAQDRYLLWRDRGQEFAKRAGKLSIADQNAAYRDNVRSGGPQSQGGGSGGAPPAAGGPR
jgi:hypothetical protein